MAIPPWNSFFKVAMISTGVLSVAMTTKLFAPSILDFLVTDIPQIYKNLVFVLRPPYLYLLVNCIILSIVASSKLHTKPSESDSHAVTEPPLKTSGGETPVYAAIYDVGVEDIDGIPTGDLKAVYRDGGVKSGSERIEEVRVLEEVTERDITERDTECKAMVFVEETEKNDSVEFSNSIEEITPVISSTNVQRKAQKSNHEVRKAVLGVSKPKKNETLESTWKAITDGRSMPLNRHLKKSDTFVRYPKPTKPPSSSTTNSRKMKKSETFSDRGIAKDSSGGLRREPSLSQDELNRRVEAFIKKFNEDMRLQRQESLNQYREMIKGVAQ